MGNNLLSLNLPIRGAMLFHDFAAGQSSSKSQSVLQCPNIVLQRAKVSLRIVSIFSIWGLPLLAGVGSISADMSCRIQPRNVRGKPISMLDVSPKKTGAPKTNHLNCSSPPKPCWILVPQILRHTPGSKVELASSSIYICISQEPHRVGWWISQPQSDAGKRSTLVTRHSSLPQLPPRDRVGHASHCTREAAKEPLHDRLENPGERIRCSQMKPCYEYIYI